MPGARITLFTSLLCVALPSVASAQRPPPARHEDASPHFHRGVELYDEADYTGALVEFKRTFELSQDSKVLFNIAQTYYQLQNYAAALETFQRYLTDGGASIAKDRRAYVEKEVQRLAGRVAMVRITVNVPNAEIAVDDEKVGVSPLDHAVMVSQGKRKITATLNGKTPATKTLEVAGGDSAAVSLEIEQEAIAPPPPPPPPPPAEMRRRIPWVAWGITGGLFAAWGVTGVFALVYSGQAQSKINTYPITQSDITGPENTAKAFALVSDIALGCTVVSAAVSLILTVIAKPEPVAEKHPPAAQLLVGPTGFTVIGRF
jgi:PEGA domain